MDNPNDINISQNNQNNQLIQQLKVNNQLNQNKLESASICQFFILRKKRQCKFQTAKGSKYCHAHCSDLQNKIQCPYEKGFYVQRSKLQKHLQNCPRIRDKQKQKKSMWYNQSINKNNQQSKQKAQMPLMLPSALKQISFPTSMIPSIILLFLKCFKGKQTFYIQSSSKQSLVQKTNDHMQAQLIAQSASNYNLIKDKFIYVEFGAGKGILSFAIANKVKQQTNKNSKHILLERQSRRHKFDRFFKDNYFFQRYKGDVSDFDFGLLTKTMLNYATLKCKTQISQQAIKDLQQSEMIGVCKHMCGQALDISVRGLLKANCKGNILASCCHHLCNYDTYLNPKFFKDQGWTPQQTQIMFKMSSWGTKAYELSPQDVKLQKLHELLSYYQKTQEATISNMTQKVIIGRMCKRLIDFGRAQFLGGNLERYCSDQLTPQNYVIISNCIN